jgi:hypothetical protein
MQTQSSSGIHITTLLIASRAYSMPGRSTFDYQNTLQWLQINASAGFKSEIGLSPAWNMCEQL